jgi:DNA-binding MarR family transcriptional regulator
MGRHYDLTVPEWRVLATLGEFQELGATAIGSHSCMHKTKVSRAVRALEGRRWLKRREVPQDRREELLSLTRLGQEPTPRLSRARSHSSSRSSNASGRMRMACSRRSTGSKPMSARNDRYRSAPK